MNVKFCVNQAAAISDSLMQLDTTLNRGTRPGMLIFFHVYFFMCALIDSLFFNWTVYSQPAIGRALLIEISANDSDETRNIRIDVCKSRVVYYLYMIFNIFQYYKFFHRNFTKRFTEARMEWISSWYVVKIRLMVTTNCQLVKSHAPLLIAWAQSVSIPENCSNMAIIHLRCEIRHFMFLYVVSRPNFLFLLLLLVQYGAAARVSIFEILRYLCAPYLDHPNHQMRFLDIGSGIWQVVLFCMPMFLIF